MPHLSRNSTDRQGMTGSEVQDRTALQQRCLMLRADVIRHKCFHARLQAFPIRLLSMSTPSMLTVPKWEASARVIMPSLQPMSRHLRFWNHGFSITCTATASCQTRPLRMRQLAMNPTILRSLD